MTDAQRLTDPLREWHKRLTDLEGLATLTWRWVSGGGTLTMSEIEMANAIADRLKPRAELPPVEGSTDAYVGSASALAGAQSPKFYHDDGCPKARDELTPAELMETITAEAVQGTDREAPPPADHPPVPQDSAWQPPAGLLRELADVLGKAWYAPGNAWDNIALAAYRFPELAGLRSIVFGPQAQRLRAAMGAQDGEPLADVMHDAAERLTAEPATVERIAAVIREWETTKLTWEDFLLSAGRRIAAMRAPTVPEADALADAAQAITNIFPAALPFSVVAELRATVAAYRAARTQPPAPSGVPEEIVRRLPDAEELRQYPLDENPMLDLPDFEAAADLIAWARTQPTAPASPAPTFDARVEAALAEFGRNQKMSQTVLEDWREVIAAALRAADALGSPQQRLSEHKDWPSGNRFDCISKDGTHLIICTSADEGNIGIQCVDKSKLTYYFIADYPTARKIGEKLVAMSGGSPQPIGADLIARAAKWAKLPDAGTTRNEVEAFDIVFAVAALNGGPIE